MEHFIQYFLVNILLFMQLHIEIHCGIGNSVDPDQMAPLYQSDLGLNCLPMLFC